VVARLHCSNDIASAISFSGSLPGTTFDWTSTAYVGFATNGIGVTSIPPYTAKNTSATTIVAIVTVTPKTTNCPGPTSSFTVTVTPQPAPPLNLGDVTNLTWRPTTPVLMVSNLSAEATIDWFDAPAGGTRLTNNSTSFIPTIPTNNLPASYAYYAQATSTNGCVNTNRT
jgi:hypothetical protein